MRLKIYFFVILSVIFISDIAYSREFIANGPLIARTQNPVYLMTLGQDPTRPVVNERGTYSFWLNLPYSNIFRVARVNNDEAYLDMEIARIAFNFTYGVGRDMELGIEIPFLHFNGGYFDKFIQEFHRAFGFPNGGRDKVPNGQFVYRITKDGRVLFNPKRKALGLSDVILSYKYNFQSETETMPAMAIRFRFKLPTGPANSGLGGGNIDYSLGYAVEKNISRWHFYVNLDYIIASGNRNFEQLYNNQMLAWLGAVEFSVSTPISLIVQVQGSTPLLTGINKSTWNGPPVDLTMGVRGTHKDLFWKNDFFWQWGFSEDLNSRGPSPDITTMLVVGVRLGKIADK